MAHDETDRDGAAIKEYYDRASEEDRLESGAFKFEALRTRELIERHAPPPPATVLDIGGGAGAYALWLAAKGYTVHLLDAAARLIDVAHQRSAATSVPLASCRVADARDTGCADSCADVVLLLGPLYHLTHASDRRDALIESLRILKPGGWLFAAAISRWASALDGLVRDLHGDAEFATIVDQDVRTGQHRNPTEKMEYFTTAYFHRPDELRDEVIAGGFELEAVYGIEGPIWLLANLDQRLADPRRAAYLLRISRMLESQPALLGVSAHLLAVGRKRS